MDMNLKLPEDIYLHVSREIERIVTSLESLSEEDEILTAKDKALETFTHISDEIKEHIAALETNAEWDTFTIAFYGETNAGKSTLIETLRILLHEPTKLAARAEFAALRDTFGLTNEQIDTMRAALAQSAGQSAALQSNLDLIDQQFDGRAQALRDQLTELQRLIDKKVGASLWQKLINMLGRLPELRQIKILKKEQQDAEAQHIAACATYRHQQGLLEQARSEQERTLREAEAMLGKLAELGDGAIIGTGRPDFTIDTQAYHFRAGAEPFALLDVPGIEGSEGKVKDEISAAVQKAHAVFYVTGKPTAPQQGQDKQEGTLQKIKRHLNAQTEVWTVYNKRITNPLPFKQAELINDGERASLADLDAKMTEELGEHYRGTISVSALPAFLALADSLSPDSAHAAGRAKFLASFSQEQILQKSHLFGLRELLLNDLVKDYKKKIYRSNFNKANQVVLAASHSVDSALKGSFRPLATQLKRNATMSGKQLDTSLDALKTRLESQGETALANCISNVRREVYSEIDKDISNDDFKAIFSRKLKKEQDELTKSLPGLMQAEVAKFQEQIAEIVERLEELASELMRSYNNIELNGVGAGIDLKIHIDNGINLPGLIGALAGGLLLFWNPAGWAILALGAATVLVGATKAVMGFFSSDYKKSQQRKSVDTNLSDIEDKLRQALRASLDEALPQVEPKVEALKQALRRPGEQVGKVVDLLAQASKQLKKISQNIETRGVM
jgi:hypothetical protein